MVLLAYLAVTGRFHSRDSLLALLWPDNDTESARANLRRTLSGLRKTIAVDFLEVDRIQVGVRADADFTIDVNQFQTLLTQAEAHEHDADVVCSQCLKLLEEAVELYRDDFMSGYHLPDSAAFDEWQFFQAEGLRQSLGTILQKLIGWYIQAGEFTKAVPHARRWLAMDPLFEPAQRQLMQLYAWSGQQAAAIRQYEQCVQTLAEELGVEPEDETRELFERIRSKQLPVPEVTIRVASAAAAQPKDRFIEESVIDQSGRADLVLGRDGRTGDQVVIRKLKPELVAQDEDLVTRFNREAAALRQINHPNIVGILANVDQDDRLQVVMEYVPGGSLRDQLKQEGPLPVARVVAIALELADALSRTHHLGIIHRNIKPDNVLLADDGTPRLTDFGVALFASDDVRLTLPGEVKGTPAYASPEALRGENLDERSDIWSFGVLLFELLTGQLPFTGDAIGVVLTNIVSQPLPDIRSLRPEVPEALDKLLRKMMVKEAANRIGTMRLVAAALENVQAGRQVDAGQVATPQPELLHRHNLPQQSAPFIGRKRELAGLRQRLLEDDESRILTLLGPGGIGKTRLATEASWLIAENQPTAFPDGVWLISLTSVSESGAFIPTIAKELDLTTFSGGDDLRQQLLNYLRNRKLLLLLDGMEHLLSSENVRFLGEILSVASGLKLMVTSRERLNVIGEQIYRVGGLDLPAGSLTMPGNLNTWESYSALQLFAEKARLAQPDFQLGNENVRQVAQICQLVHGVPLGIILSAAWLELLSLDEIVKEIQHGLDFLETEWHDIPARQRSLRAVFDSSWRLLGEKSQTILRKLSVFQAGFTREASQQVADASLRTLLDLSHASWLSRDNSGRYQIHELLRQYAEEQLDEDLALSQDIRNRHSRYYGARLTSLSADLFGDQQLAALQAISDDIENIRSGWQWSLSELAEDVTWLSIFDQYIGPLFNLFDTRSRFEEGETLYRQAAADLEAIGDERREARIVLAKVQARQGWFAFHMGRHNEAIHLLEKTGQQLVELDAQREAIFSLNYLGAVRRHLGDFQGAQRHLDESAALSRAFNDRFGLTVALNVAGQIAFAQGDLVKARALCQESLAIKREIGDSWGMTFSLSYLGTVALALGDLAEAETLFAESLTTSEALGDRRGVATNLSHLGEIAAAQGDVERAVDTYQESLKVFEEINNSVGVIDVRTRLAGQAISGGQTEVAFEHLRAAASSAFGLQNTPQVLALLTMVAVWKEAIGEDAGVAELLFLSQYHPASSPENRQMAEAMLAASERPVSQLQYRDLDQAVQVQLQALLAQ